MTFPFGLCSLPSNPGLCYIDFIQEPNSSIMTTTCQVGSLPWGLFFTLTQMLCSYVAQPIRMFGSQKTLLGNHVHFE